jgi:hypothetical protein
MNFRHVSQVMCVAGAALAAAPGVSLAQSVTFADQGKDWSASSRKDFYGRDQGSRLIPQKWIAALKQDNGQPFLADSLTRYGYLPNPDSSPSGLAVGFVVANEGGEPTLGLTCSACHTRQIEVDGKAYRIDGGPAIADLWLFWGDLDKAVGKVLSSPAAFTDFASSVIGPNPTPAQEAALREDVQAWYARSHAITEHGLPAKQWGVGRLDAVGMILNRVTGLDIGDPPSYIYEKNIAPADAPVRPPFLWNAWRQDQTQWPGFAENGDDILALARNSGEVYGVFGVAHPKKDAAHLLGIDYLHDNTVNFKGLDALEDLIKRIGPPRWPWSIDAALAGKGKEIFAWPTDKGGCAECHGIRRGEPRLLNPDTWATPIQDVGTDSREYHGLIRQADTKVLEGAFIPVISDPLKAQDSSVAVLGLVVRGAILQHFVPVVLDPLARFNRDVAVKVLEPQIRDLKNAFKKQETKMPPVFKYESRVLEGIWAAAPYLHNASVPSLAELLKPAAERVSEFKVGPAYDTVNVGLAANQAKLNYTMKTTDCSSRDSGDSRCGHEFGPKLSPDEKKALLEYLKTL